MAVCGTSVCGAVFPEIRQIMKTKMMMLLVALFAAVGLSSCASVGSSNTRSLLSASGFQEKTPETARQKELYAKAEPYKLMRVKAKNGKVVYAYKDEKTGTAFVGSESNYQQYQKLAVQQQIAREQYQAAEMERDMAYGWYGAYGYSPYGPAPVGYYR